LGLNWAQPPGLGTAPSPDPFIGGEGWGEDTPSRTIFPKYPPPTSRSWLRHWIGGAMLRNWRQASARFEVSTSDYACCGVNDLGSVVGLIQAKPSWPGERGATS